MIVVVNLKKPGGFDNLQRQSLICGSGCQGIRKFLSCPWSGVAEFQSVSIHTPLDLTSMRYKFAVGLRVASTNRSTVRGPPSTESFAESRYAFTRMCCGTELFVPGLGFR